MVDPDPGGDMYRTHANNRFDIDNHIQGIFQIDRTDESTWLLYSVSGEGTVNNQVP